mmetsp:Transcript_28650/g.73162  ORF Transcript_28650/g.73162 Transcript_28650/m.73162 type:complete len:221 (+) Transcript_28650:1261-1923(+)
MSSFMTMASQNSSVSDPCSTSSIMYSSDIAYARGLSYRRTFSANRRAAAHSSATASTPFHTYSTPLRGVSTKNTPRASKSDGPGFSTSFMAGTKGLKSESCGAMRNIMSILPPGSDVWLDELSRRGSLLNFNRFDHDFSCTSKPKLGRHMPRLSRTYSSAWSYESLSFVSMYAIAMDADRDTPCVQCTSTRAFGSASAFSMKVMAGYSTLNKSQDGLSFR